MQLIGDGITLRDLAVRDDGTAGANFLAVVVGPDFVDTQNWVISGISVAAMGATSSNIAVRTLSDCGGGSLHNVTAEASGGNVSNRGFDIQCGSGFISAMNVTGVATGTNSRGLFKAGSSMLTVTVSSFAGDSDSVDASGATGLFKVISSELDGSVGTNLGGPIVCVGNYDGSGAVLANGTFGSGGCVP